MAGRLRWTRLEEDYSPERKAEPAPLLNYPINPNPVTSVTGFSFVKKTSYRHHLDF